MDAWQSHLEQNISTVRACDEELSEGRYPLGAYRGARSVGVHGAHVCGQPRWAAQSVAVHGGHMCRHPHQAAWN